MKTISAQAPDNHSWETLAYSNKLILIQIPEDPVY